MEKEEEKKLKHKTNGWMEMHVFVMEKTDVSQTRECQNDEVVLCHAQSEIETACRVCVCGRVWMCSGHLV